MEMLIWFSERVGFAAPWSGTTVLVARFARNRSMQLTFTPQRRSYASKASLSVA
jgi:hypothetical protein